MTKNQQILDLAVLAGEILVQNGGEIYRVEDTVKRILTAYQIQHFHIYVLSNGIFAAIEPPQEDPCFLLRHITFGTVNLERIAAVNQLSREICASPCPPEEILPRMRACERLDTHPLWSKSLASGLGCACFTLLYGGGFADSLFSFLTGSLLQFLLEYFLLHGFSRFFYTIAASAFVTSFCLLPYTLHLPLRLDMIIIGCIMPLVPGLALTNSIRDFFNGDYLSGLIHLMDALLTSVCIASGVGFILTIYQSLGGVLP